MASIPTNIRQALPVSGRLLAVQFPGGLAPSVTVESLPAFLARRPERLGPYPFLPDLVRVEAAAQRLRAAVSQRPSLPIETLSLNPDLEVLAVDWQGLPEFLHDGAPAPVAGPDTVLAWRPPGTDSVRIESASGHDLLALKIVCEALDPRQAAAAGGVSLGRIEDVLYTGVQRGLLLAPPSRVDRPPEWAVEGIDPEFLVSPTFTLQWHLTQACDLHCRHCYDRSDLPAMPLARAVRVLDDLYDFCRNRNVYGQVSFTGGNPLLYPGFDTLYGEAVDRGLLVALLGNPAPRRRIEALCAARPPEFYQLSLEGLPAHNDHIRGAGHFDRVLAFLDLLGELGVYRMIMLTLTAANLDQVLPLAERLAGRVERFTFNRLTPVGEGAALETVSPARWRTFLAEYLAAARTRPHMGLKDNLFNILLAEAGRPLFGGCTGYGCGAAFNFAALLPDGEVHACRKFPSPIGHLADRSLEDVYASPEAERYRRGSAACRDCRLRPVCGGCLAVTAAMGADPFTARDPYCFLAKSA